MGTAYAFGLHHYLSLETVAFNRDLLKSFVASHMVLAIGIFMTAYVAIVALSLPVAAVMSIAGGFLFGSVIGVPVVVVSATLGGFLVFEAVRSSFGQFFAQRSGPFLQKLSSGFAEDAFSYLLFLRLVPVFPFFAVNAVAGLCKVSRVTFLGATVIGIIPATIAYTWLGTGLDSIIDAQAERHRDCLKSGATECNFHLDLGRSAHPRDRAGVRGAGGGGGDTGCHQALAALEERLRFDIAVMGAGSGGLSVAAAAAQFGQKVVLFEKGKMGGDCLNYGCVPSKALIAAAKHAQALRDCGRFGIAAAEPQIDFAEVHGPCAARHRGDRTP